MRDKFRSKSVAADHSIQTMADADSSHVKITFALEQDEDGYPPYAVENLWAIQRADGYEVDNIPWYAKGIACGDLVAAKPDGDGPLAFERVLRRGGNSTLRVWLSAAAVEKCQQLRQAIEAAGATSELNGTRFLSVDVPPGAVSAVWAYLEDGENRGYWEFEVGYLAELQP